MLFGFYDHKSNNILAFQLIPHKDVLQDAPIVSFDKIYQECFTFAPNIDVGMLYLVQVIGQEDKVIWIW